MSSGSYPPYKVVAMPKLSPTMDSGSILEWKKAEGEEISAGDAIAEIETDKASMDFESGDDGYLAKVRSVGKKKIGVRNPPSESAMDA